MRSLDAYKAEIFRRSEIKIKQRKKTRNRILAACIPLCLCIGIGTVGFPAGGFGAKSENMAAAPESAGWNGFMVLEENDASYATLPGTSNHNTSESMEGEAALKPNPIVKEEVFLSEERIQDYETAKAILLELDYSPHKVCRCLPQYKLKTDFGEFGIHLSEGYARCEEGQADLTTEQIQTLRQIINNLKKQ